MTRGVAALIAFVLAACASPNGGEAPREAAPPTTAVTPATSTTTRPPSRDPLQLEVTLDDYEMRPATTIVAAAGAYQLAVTTVTIEPGGTGSLVATLHPRTYVLGCTVPHHYVRDRMAVVLTMTA